MLHPSTSLVVEWIWVSDQSGTSQVEIKSHIYTMTQRQKHSILRWKLAPMQYSVLAFWLPGADLDARSPG